MLGSKQLLPVAHSVHAWLPLTEVWNYNQIKHLPSTIESHVVCKDVTNRAQFPIKHLHRWIGEGVYTSFWHKVMRKLRVRTFENFTVSEIRKNKIKLLHSHFGPVAYDNLEAVRRTGVKHVATFYGFDVNMLPKVEPVYRERYKQLFEQVDLVLCEGPFMAQSIAKLGCPEQKIRVHTLGVQVDELAFQPRRWQPGKPLKVLISASFREKKGITYALEALARVQDEVELEITVIGDANDEERNQREKANILSTIDHCQLTSKVRLLGYQPHQKVFDEAYQHHLFLSPSVTASNGDTEGGAPVSIIELGATGMVVVSTRHCDIPFVVEEGAGLLADERDVDGLVDDLRWLISNPDDWEGMILAFRRRVEECFNANVQGQRLSEIYQGLIE